MDRLSAHDAASVVNPLIDLGYIADEYLGGAGACSALEAATQYSKALLPLGVSPHPLIVGDLFRMCHPSVSAQEERGEIKSWVEVLLSTSDQSGHSLVPILDPAFVLAKLRMTTDDLQTRGASSVGRYYLGEAAGWGCLPHPLFDPVFVRAERTGYYPTKKHLADPGSLLTLELSYYLRQAVAGGRASPSIGFDEELYRSDDAVKTTIEQRRFANGFHFFVALDDRVGWRGLTHSGIHSFPNEATPTPWWRPGNLSGKKLRQGSAKRTLFKTAKRRLQAARHPPVAVQIDGDVPVEVRLGQTITFVVHGSAMSPAGRLVGTDLFVDDKKVSGAFQGFPRPDLAPSTRDLFDPTDRLFCGFAVAWRGKAARAGEMRIALRFRVSTSKGTRATEKVDVGRIAVRKPSISIRSGPQSQIAIAMATYNPGPGHFEKQLESIRAQTMSDWSLVISDESTEVASRETIARCVGQDPRIRLMHGRRLGFVGNFERALLNIDRRSPFFALSDQDDVWYPEKLDVLREAIRTEPASLVYNGMRIVSEDGSVIDDSLFSWRRRHEHGTDDILLANTVTGAAMVGRTELLLTALPIPRYTAVFHDVWLALVASKLGDIHFVDQVLQDYVQHDTNVLGQNADRDRQSAHRFDQDRRLLEEFRGVLFTSKNRVDDAAMVSISTALLPAIIGVWPAAVQREFLSFALGQTRGDLGLAALAKASAQRSQRVGTDDPRVFLSIPHWLRVGTDILERVVSRRSFARQIAKASLQTAAAAVGASSRVTQQLFSELKEKIRMDYRVVADSSFDVTMLIPEVRREVVFAGYLAKFHLAKRLAEAGLRVRLVLVDQIVADLQARIDIVMDHPDLTGLFDRVTIEEWGVRDRPIALSPNEALIATTWWTAHIAHKLRPVRRFLYFIQEWEPLTVSQGAWAAAAEQSYRFPHDALFSTSILADFFRHRRLGVYDHDVKAEGAQALSLQHPATPSLNGCLELEERERLIVCYARPEPHAARNLFEIMVLGLEKAFELLGSSRLDWRAIGIGASEAMRIPIGKAELEIVERGSIANYRRLLARSRVGVAPMHAPHPGMVALDMAASGLRVATTSYETKSQAAFDEISPLIKCVAPTPDDLGTAIADAAWQSCNQQRVALIRWPLSWNEALNEKLIRLLLRQIKAQSQWVS
ncbi:glycosyltransferase [Parvibaculum sp.]|uniref:rhamnosyltransferase WsaF family glycosyltransferase n=1 Tax=Parvibaculum sp. TaxID=2024848 RepID=UPI00329A44BE